MKSPCQEYCGAVWLRGGNISRGNEIHVHRPAPECKYFGHIRQRMTKLVRAVIYYGGRSRRMLMELITERIPEHGETLFICLQLPYTRMHSREQSVTRNSVMEHALGSIFLMKYDLITVRAISSTKVIISRKISGL